MCTYLLVSVKRSLRRKLSLIPRSLVVQSSLPAIERPGFESERRWRIFFSEKFLGAQHKHTYPAMPF